MNMLYENHMHKILENETERLVIQTEQDIPFIESCLEPLDLSRVTSVLDIGCGIGALLFALKKHVSEECVMYGLDFVKNRLERGKLLINGDCQQNIHFVYGSGYRIPFQDCYFDLVSCRYLLQHIRELTRILKEMKRVTKPNGHILILDINNLVPLEEEKFPNLYKRNLCIQNLYTMKGLHPHTALDVINACEDAGLKLEQRIPVTRNPNIAEKTDQKREQYVHELLVNILHELTEKEYQDALKEMEIMNMFDPDERYNAYSEYLLYFINQ